MNKIQSGNSENLTNRGRGRPKGAINKATKHFRDTVNSLLENNADNVQQFTAQANYFEHTDCYSIVKHNTKGNLYLYASFNNAKSFYFIDNVQATKQEVAQYLTASAAAQLLNSTATTHNVTHNVTHSVVVRTIALANIVSINAMQQQLVAA